MAQNKAYAMMAVVVLAAGAGRLAAHSQSTQQQTPPPPKQHQPITDRTEISKTFWIDAIDYNSRLVSLRDSDGKIEMVTAGPQIQRLNELKVGDKVTFRYYESIVSTIRPAGQAAPTTPAASGVVRDTGPKPGGYYAEQVTATVQITAFDPKVPSVTIKTDADKVMSFKVKDKKALEGVKVGDRVDITYTRGLAVKVE